MVIISEDVEKPDKLNLPQEHSSNTNSDLNCIPLCSVSPIPGYIASIYSHTRLLGRDTHDDCMSQERLDYAVITSKPLPYNHIGLDFVHIVSPSQVARLRVQPLETRN